MVNINKIKTLAKNQGITIAFICKQLGNGRGYLNDVANGKNTMPDERIRKTAQILGTTFEYLTDQTDDPKPKNKKPLEIPVLLGATCGLRRSEIAALDLHNLRDI